MKLRKVTIVTCDITNAGIDKWSYQEKHMDATSYPLVFIWSKSDQWFKRWVIANCDITNTPNDPEQLQGAHGRYYLSIGFYLVQIGIVV